MAILFRPVNNDNNDDDNNYNNNNDDDNDEDDYYDWYLFCVWQPHIQERPGACELMHPRERSMLKFSLKWISNTVQ